MSEKQARGRLRLGAPMAKVTCCQSSNNKHKGARTSRQFSFVLLSGGTPSPVTASVFEPQMNSNEKRKAVPCKAQSPHGL